MFLGHAAVGFAAKRLAPRAPLPILLLAPWLLDLLWPIFLLAGVESVRIDPGNTAFTPLDFVSYPWSHSLVMAIGWALLAAFAYAAWRRDRAGAVWIGALVASHWVLDAVVHRPDLPLWPGGGPRVGLGLWNHVAVTLVIELSLFAAGLLVYLRTTRSRGRWGVASLVVLVAVLLTIYLSNELGPPPPGAAAIAWVMLAFGVLVGLGAAWIERTRSLRSRVSAGG